MSPPLYTYESVLLGPVTPLLLFGLAVRPPPEWPAGLPSMAEPTSRCSSAICSTSSWSSGDFAGFLFPDGVTAARSVWRATQASTTAGTGLSRAGASVATRGSCASLRASSGSCTRGGVSGRDGISVMPTSSRISLMARTFGASWSRPPGTSRVLARYTVDRGDGKPWTAAAFSGSSTRAPCRRSTAAGTVVRPAAVSPSPVPVPLR